MKSDPANVALLVSSHGQDDERSARELASLLYFELERLAQARMRHERANHSLEVGDLVNEACRRLIVREAPYEGRTHFLALGAKVLRQVLLDHERARRAQKRDRERDPLSLTNHELANEATRDAVHFDELLSELARDHPRPARVVEMRFFGGMTQVEVAEVLGCTDRTVRDDWRFARAWLRARLSPGSSGL